MKTSTIIFKTVSLQLLNRLWKIKTKLADVNIFEKLKR